MNPDHTPKPRLVWPTLRVKIACGKKWVWIDIFKPAEPHSSWDPRLWDACLYCDRRALKSRRESSFGQLNFWDRLRKNVMKMKKKMMMMIFCL